MRAKYALLLVLIAGPPLLLSGCATQALWEQGTLANYREPATQPNLTLFESTSGKDVLVLYDEATERNDSIRRRAYWLSKNSERIRARRKPHFVSVNAGKGLTSIPITDAPQPGAPAVPSGPYAITSTSSQSFTLQWSDRQTGPYELPVYPDASGRTKQALLTPLTVAADLTIVGGCLAVIVAAAYAGGSWYPCN